MKVLADMTGNLERFQGATGSGGLFLSGTDGDVVAVGAGNGTGDEDDAIFRTDGNDLEILHGGTGGSHVAGHLLVFPNATWSRAATDGSRPAVHHGAVGHFQTTEAVALHSTLETAALGLAEHVNPLADGEGFEARMNRGKFNAVFDAEFLDETFWSATGLLGDADGSLGGALFLLIAVADLDRGVTVGFRSLGLENRITGNIDNSDGDHDAGLLIEQAGHTDFFAEEAE